MTRDGPSRVGLYLSVTTDSPSSATAAIKQIVWPERALEWLESWPVQPERIGCGFDAADAYAEYSESDQELPETLVLQPGTVHAPTLMLSCSVEAHEQEPPVTAASCLLAVLSRSQLLDAVAAAVRVELVSACARLPLQPLTHDALTVDAECEPAEAFELLQRRGMLVLPKAALAPADLRALRRLARAHVRRLEAQLRLEGEGEGEGMTLEGGKLRYAEVCSRGRCRWDALLRSSDGEMVVVGAADSEADDAGAADAEGDDTEAAVGALLARVATDAPWCGAVRAALGDDYLWQASLVCSRPGAPAGGWHADGGHGRYSYPGGESAPLPYALCAFVPLVPLASPSRRSRSRDDGDGDDGPGATPRGGGIAHGLGCTAFWPGSHRFAECLHLGRAAARLGAALPGAPLEAGGALLYDYRLVHAGAPNDREVDGVDRGAADGEEARAAEELGEVGLRPILQLTYCRAQYRDRFRNYGFEQLFCD